ncbi:lysoplasmalogenase [Umezawaea sp. Da 62-37]|uniref:lysoplasmalogenase n=1 Tax=Umezawaea sp. Da 62-37 TaxID=3075927 RepID=UPI0028F7428F|nr:lysoplasmalogenase [Umezawaea sp. Da 62-37]WNV87938.1 lysoplasmalogenase [Umezawaea sp. Da 62-37]
MKRRTGSRAARTVFPVVAAVDCVAAVRRGTRVRRVSKPAVLAVLAAGHPPADPALAFGLAASWAGDVALLGSSDRAFRAGLGSFLVAHLGYVVALGRGSVAGSRGAVAPIMAGFATAAWFSARAAGPLGRPVAAYALTIGAMVAAASTSRGPGATRIVGGAVLFAVSDALLGAGRFALTGTAARVAAAGVMPTYAAAQHLIHTGFARRPGRR